MSKLTGKTRHRCDSKFFGGIKLILQVEEEWEDGPDDWHGMPEYLSGKGWRDASPEDLQYLPSVTN